MNGARMRGPLVIAVCFVAIVANLGIAFGQEASPRASPASTLPPEPKIRAPTATRHRR